MGKGGGNKQVTTQETQLPPWVTQAAQGNLALANTLTEPFVQNMPDHMVAPFNVDQNKSFDITRNFAAGQSPNSANDLGYSYYRGFADRSPYTMAQMGGIPQMRGASVASAPTMTAASIGPVQDVHAGRFTDADINMYMNPYTENVVDTSLADLRDEYSRSLASSNLNQAASGAFGGARHGIREAQAADDHLRNVARTTSGLRNQAFGAASGLIQNDQNRAFQAAQANQSAAQQRASQQAQLDQEANRHAADSAQQRAMQQAQLNQQATQANAEMVMQGRQADIASRYGSDQQRLGAVQGMADATLRAQQMQDQRVLQNAALLNDVGTQQQQNEQASLDAPFRALDIRNSTLRGTPFPQTSTTTTSSGGGGKGGLLSSLGSGLGSSLGSGVGTSLASNIGRLATLSHSSTKTDLEPVKGTLDKLRQLPLYQWQYRLNRPYSDGLSHIGPKAEDMKDVFEVGDGLTINMTDALGVVLAALQELSRDVDDLKSSRL